MIECGVSIRRIRECLKFRLTDVCGCLVSHGHGDHSKAVLDVQKAGVDCYMSEETAQAVGANGHRTHIIEPLKQFRVGQFTVMPFETEHDCAGSLGFLISDGTSKLVFATDTFYIKHKFVGISIFAVECNYSKETLSPDLDHAVKRRLLRSHFSLENVIQFLQANDLSQCQAIHLLHLSDANSDAEMFRRRVMQATGKPVYVGADRARQPLHRADNQAAHQTRNRANEPVWSHKMTQQEWRDTFLGDIQSLYSVKLLRVWAARWAEDIKRDCPDYVDEIRAAYVARIEELKKACAT